MIVTLQGLNPKFVDGLSGGTVSVVAQHDWQLRPVHRARSPAFRITDSLNVEVGIVRRLKLGVGLRASGSGLRALTYSPPSEPLSGAAPAG